MEKEVLESVLKRFEKESKVSKVLSVDSAPAVGKNENLLSTVSRLTVKVVQANGRVATRSLIVKERKPTDQNVTCIVNASNVFKTETMIYTTVLNEMEYMMEEYEDTGGVLWCRLIHYVPYTSLVLEDLTAKGFVLKNKGDFWDLDHTLMAVNALGRYHGMCKVLEERGTISKNDYQKWFIFNDFRSHQFWVWNMKAAIKGIKRYWSSSWSAVVNKINVTEEGMHEKMHDMGNADENKFKVLNHGDCHMSNIMFKHNWQNQPIDIRFLDFQMPHYSSPCCDLTYVLYLGPDLSVRRNNYELILKTYHENLLKTLDKYNFGGSKPDLQEIKGLMDKYSFLGLYIAICICAAQMADKNQDNCLDADKIMATSGKEGYNLEIYNNKALEETLGPDIKRFVEEFF